MNLGVKIMNASKKSDYTVVKFGKQGQKETTSDMNYWLDSSIG